MDSSVGQDDNDAAKWQFVWERDFPGEVEHYFRSKHMLMAQLKEQ